MNKLNQTSSEILKEATTLLSSRVSNLSAAELLSTLKPINKVFERGQKKTRKGHQSLFFELERLVFTSFSTDIKSLYGHS